MINFQRLAIALSLLLFTHASAPADEERKIDASQFTYHNYTSSLDFLERKSKDLKNFTRHMLKNSTNPKLRRSYSLNLRLIKPDTTATFIFSTGGLVKYQDLLSWEMQHIGLPNMFIRLRGYGYISQKQILELKLESTPKSEIYRKG